LLLSVLSADYGDFGGLKAMRGDPRLLTYQGRSRNRLQRALVMSALVVLGAGLLILTVFFVTVALAAGAVLAAIIAIRFWWIGRRIKRQSARHQPIEGEYQVVHRDHDRHPR
jgi:hypothetical protein